VVEELQLDSAAAERKDRTAAGSLAVQALGCAVAELLCYVVLAKRLTGRSVRFVFALRCCLPF